MRDRLIELLNECQHAYDKEVGEAIKENRKPIFENAFYADHLLAAGVIVPPCKVGDTVYEIEPLWYGIWGEDEHKCRKCEHFYEGGMGDPSDCSLGKNCCYHIVEKKADFRQLGDWLTPNGFTGKIAWGKTVFLTREEAEKALEERRGGRWTDFRL